LRRARASDSISANTERKFRREVIAMLAEKFFLMLETIRSRSEEQPRPVISTAPHIPIKVDPPRKK
jgi:hypothetical protein